MKSFQAESAIPFILSLLAKKEMFGYEIIISLKNHSDYEITWKEGCLYPVLKLMEQKGLINTYWKADTPVRPRKYYIIKPPKRSWFRFS